MEKQSLESLKEGDLVVLQDYSFGKLNQVQRTTETLIYVANRKFRRASGHEITNSKWAEGWIRIPNEKLIEKLQTKELRDEIKNLFDRKLHSLNKQQLNAIKQIIEGDRNG